MFVTLCFYFSPEDKSGSLQLRPFRSWRGYLHFVSFQITNSHFCWIFNKTLYVIKLYSTIIILTFNVRYRFKPPCHVRHKNLYTKIIKYLIADVVDKPYTTTVHTIFRMHVYFFPWVNDGVRHLSYDISKNSKCWQRLRIH